MTEHDAGRDAGRDAGHGAGHGADGRADPSAADGLGLLATTGWLAEQPAWFRALIVAHGSWRSYDRDERIVAAQTTLDGLYGVAEGCIDFFIPVQGEGLVRAHRYRAGQWWGTVGIFAGRPALTETRAAEPSRLWRAPSAALAEIVAARPDAWPCFAALSYRNVSTTLTLLGEALALPPTARLARRILLLADGGMHVSATLDDLAALIGVTRSTAQRAIGDLVRAGAIEKRYRQVVLRDRAALERIGGREEPHGGPGVARADPPR
jgi:CRP-like cAMP-binding protein